MNMKFYVIRIIIFLFILSISSFLWCFISLKTKTSSKIYEKLNIERCNMQNCFNFSKCNSENFKIYVYHEPRIVKSTIYEEILNASFESPYYTSNPKEACLYLLQIDTLDRDPLSKNYIQNVTHVIKNLTLWNDGQNHVLFNHYSGTWPSYLVNDWSFNTNKAIRIQASLSLKDYRHNFDISFPLFHHDFNKHLFQINQHNKKKYFLTFKGKRYLIGIGSQTRNTLYHLHNDRDIIMLTTCNHISNMKFIENDSRCKFDEDLYNKYDYNDLLYNSTFCLVPRGRRLGTFRFLETLKANCIPVLLSDGIVLPFSEIIDWSDAVIWISEHRISQIPSILRQISVKRIQKMRKKCMFLYETYFSSIRQIVNTSFEILRKRVNGYETSMKKI